MYRGGRLHPKFNLVIRRWVDVSPSFRAVSYGIPAHLNIEIYPNWQTGWNFQTQRQKLKRLQKFLGTTFPDLPWLRHGSAFLGVDNLPVETALRIYPVLIVLFNHCVEWRFYSESLDGKQEGSFWRTAYFTHTFRCVGEKITLDTSQRDFLYPKDWDAFTEVFLPWIPIAPELNTLVASTTRAVAAHLNSADEVRNLPLPKELREGVWHRYALRFQQK